MSSSLQSDVGFVEAVCFLIVTNCRSVMGCGSWLKVNRRRKRNSGVECHEKRKSEVKVKVDVCDIK